MLCNGHHQNAPHYSRNTNTSPCAYNVVQVVCHHLSSRKAGLVQVGCPSGPDDRTAFIFLPRGLGTMDELLELLTLLQHADCCCAGCH
jgi:hypothetical protein